MEFNPQKQLAGLLEWMDQQMTQCGGKTAVIGISGGKDSSTVAALAVAAYGRENVYGVLLPNGVQPDIDYSQALVEHLQIPHCTINIHDAVQGVLQEMEKAGLTPSRQTAVNLPSRVRMATLYAVAQTLPAGIVINTSNLSEDWVGYCTIYGDSAGAFSPLGMYTTEEVIALGRVLGLPEKFLVKAPSDGLTGLTDEDNLGFTYHAVNEYVRRGVCDPAIRDIILRIRLLKAVTALLAGAALAASGLQMQTLFRNPLAGPYVLGISSGAGLGVALFLLGAPLLGVSAHSFVQSLGIAGAAWLGAALVLLVVMAVSRRIKDIMVILILGMMFGSGISSVVEILQYLSSEAALKSFVIWTMGSLGDVTGGNLALMLPVVAAGLVLSVAAIKPLNLLLLGENYARTMGLNVQRTRTLLFLSTVLLAGTVTAFCGPVGFIGLAVPHLARMLFASADHRILMPGSMLAGAALLLVCDLISKTLALPINTVTALMGIPVVIIVVVRNRNLF
jgi:iron complex transport system permease protein